MVECKDDDVNKPKTKMQKKRSRLYLYPLNFKFYRCSRGLEKPTIIYEPIGNVRKRFKKPVKEITYDLIDEFGIIHNTIYKAEFKKSLPSKTKKW